MERLPYPRSFISEHFNRVRWVRLESDRRNEHVAHQLEGALGRATLVLPVDLPLEQHLAAHSQWLSMALKDHSVGPERGLLDEFLAQTRTIADLISLDQSDDVQKGSAWRAAE